MAKAADRIQRGILGDINPEPTHPSRPDYDRNPDEEIIQDRMERDEAIRGGGSRRDDSRPTGGGFGTKVGGSRNYRQGSGAAGGDIGNRPE
jgi:hypothetical protein